MAGATDNARAAAAHHEVDSHIITPIAFREGRSAVTVGRAAESVNGVPRGELLDAYRKMRTIRTFEDRLYREFRTGVIPGFVHLLRRGRRRSQSASAHTWFEPPSPVKATPTCPSPGPLRHDGGARQRARRGGRRADVKGQQDFLLGGQLGSICADT